MVRGPEGPPTKQARNDQAVALPANVIIQFQNDSGELVGDLPSQTLCIESAASAETKLAPAISLHPAFNHGLEPLSIKVKT